MGVSARLAVAAAACAAWSWTRAVVALVPLPPASLPLPRGASRSLSSSLLLSTKSSSSNSSGVEAMWASSSSPKRPINIYDPLKEDEPSSEAVKQIFTLDEYQKELETNRHRLMAVKMYSTECRMCKAIQAPYEALAAANQGSVGWYRVNFYSSDVRSALRVTHLPTIVLIAGPLGVVDKFVCKPGSWPTLEKKVQKYSALMKRLGQGSGGLIEKVLAQERGVSSYNGEEAEAEDAEIEGVCRIGDPNCKPSYATLGTANKGMIEKLNGQEKEKISLSSLTDLFSSS